MVSCIKIYRGNNSSPAFTLTKVSKVAQRLKSPLTGEALPILPAIKKEINMRHGKTNFNNANRTLQIYTLKISVECLFYMVFAFVFTIFVGGMIYGNQRYGIIAPLVVPLILLFFIIVLYISVVVNRFSDFIERHYFSILTCSLGIMFLINMITGLIL